MRDPYRTEIDALDRASLPPTDDCRVQFATLSWLSDREVLGTLIGVASLITGLVLGMRMFGALIPLVLTFRITGSFEGPALGPRETSPLSGVARGTASFLLLLMVFVFFGMTVEYGPDWNQYRRLQPLFLSVFAIQGLIAAAIAWHHEETFLL